MRMPCASLARHRQAACRCYTVDQIAILLVSERTLQDALEAVDDALTLHTTGHKLWTRAMILMKLGKHMVSHPVSETC